MDKQDTISYKIKYHILTYHVNSTYAKVAPATLQNKKNNEIMRYMGGTLDSPILYGKKGCLRVRHLWFVKNNVLN